MFVEFITTLLYSGVDCILSDSVGTGILMNLPKIGPLLVLKLAKRS
jgi:hypothetical protein